MGHSCKLCTDVMADMSTERLIDLLLDDEAYFATGRDQEWVTDIP